MTLAALIRKRGTGKSATAIPAISATQQGEAAETVARIATIAIAIPPQAQADTPRSEGGGKDAGFTVVPANDAEALAKRAVGHRELPARSHVDRRELAHLVATFHAGAGDTDVVIGECVRDALARPEAALRCYRALWERKGVK